MQICMRFLGLWRCLFEPVSDVFVELGAELALIEREVHLDGFIVGKSGFFELDLLDRDLFLFIVQF